MAYTAISDFKYGLDRRRPQTSGVPGTLWTLRNAVITRGGDIERMKKFVSTYSLPAGTLGGFSVRGQVFVFGHATTPSGMPTGVRYQQLAAPSTPALIEVLDAKGFGGNVYAIAAYDDGNIYHFYKGSRVTAWDGLADAAASFDTVAARLARLIDGQSAYKAIAFGNVVEITAAVAGTDFTLATSTTDNGSGSTPTAVAATVQANVVAVAEVRASATVTITGGTADAGTNTISSLTVDGTQLLDSAVDWSGSNSDTANALAVAINNFSATSSYTASAVGAVVTIQAAVGAGAAPNGDAVVVTTAGDVTASKTDMAGGVAAVAAVAKVATVTIGGGTIDPVDLWQVTLDSVDYRTTGRASATGTMAFVHRSRVYSLANSLIRFCKINDPTDWTDTNASSGAGFINVSNEVEGATDLYAMAKYEQYVAVFGRNATVIYDLPADAEGNTIVQPLDNTGTLAHRSVVAYGANDVFYLDETGVRSLRTRDAIQSAYASDVGSAADPFVQDVLREVGDAAASLSSAVIEAADGRYMLAVGRYVLVLSQFPASKIVAWSYFDFGEEIDSLFRVNRTVYLRAGDTIYVYGGTDGQTYPGADEFEPYAETPFISAKDPAGIKMLEGFDMAAENAWRVDVLPDPNNPAYHIPVGVIPGTTYPREMIKLPGRTSHYALRMQCSAAGRATLSSTAVHHSAEEKG